MKTLFDSDSKFFFFFKKGRENKPGRHKNNTHIAYILLHLSHKHNSVQGKLVVGKQQPISHACNKHACSADFTNLSISSTSAAQSFFTLGWHSLYLKQLEIWSFTIPAACINEQTIVGPTQRKPLFIISLLMTSAFGVLTGTLRAQRNPFTIGL